MSFPAPRSSLAPLVEPNRTRRPRPASRIPRALALTLMLAPAQMAATSPAHAETDAGIDPPEHLQELARDFLAELLSGESMETRVEIRPLDRRLRLTRCADTPVAQLAPGARPSGNTTVNLRCSGPVRWSVFVPARIERFTEVAVVARPLARQQLIEADDIRLERLEVSGLAGGYFDRAAAVVGQQTRRPLTPGQVVTGAHLAPRQLVRRGQGVTLVAETSGMQVRMSGEALEAGAVGQRIRVRNRSSGRIVEGHVQSSGDVRIPL